MNWSKLILNLYVNSSIHVSIAVLALCLLTSLEFSITPSFSIFMFVFCGSIVGYNFIKYVHLVGTKNKEYKAFQNYIGIISLIFLCIGVYFSLDQSDETLIITSIFAVITFLYSIPIISKKNFRNFAGIKIFLVALVWAGVTVLIPLIGANQEVTWDHGLTFIQRFILVIVLTLPFEIRDMEADPQRLKTIPQKFGLSITKVLGGVLLFLAVAIELLKGHMNSIHLISLVLVSTITFAALYFTRKGMSYYYSAFWVESIPIVWVWIFFFLDYFIEK